MRRSSCRGTWDLATGSAQWDARGRELIGLAERDTTVAAWFARIHPEDRATVEAELQEIQRVGGTFDQEYRIVLPQGEVRFIHGTGAVQVGRVGQPRRSAGLVRDVTEQRQWAQSQELLIGELNHRVKNMLAVVQSIADQTQRSAASPAEFVTAFEQRLQALARAHRLLTERNWQGAALRELAEETLQSLVEGTSQQIVIDGPPIDLSANATITLAMVLNELGTNALKHGALSAPRGTVRLRWRVVAANDGGRRLILDWLEHGGPWVGEPARKGFGTTMLKKGVAWELEGSVHLDYRKEGLVCTMEFPINGKLRLGRQPAASAARRRG